MPGLSSELRVRRVVTLPLILTPTAITEYYCSGKNGKLASFHALVFMQVAPQHPSEPFNGELLERRYHRWWSRCSIGPHHMEKCLLNTCGDNLHAAVMVSPESTGTVCRCPSSGVADSHHHSNRCPLAAARRMESMK